MSETSVLRIKKFNNLPGETESRLKEGGNNSALATISPTHSKMIVTTKAASVNLKKITKIKIL